MKKNILHTIDTIDDIRDNIINNKNQKIALEELFDSEEEINELLKRLESCERVKTIQQTLISRDVAKDAQRLKLTLDNMKRKRRKISLTIVSSVASITLLFFMITNYMNDQNSVITNIPYDLVTTETSALTPILITESGEAINLDEIENNAENPNFTFSKDAKVVEYNNEKGSTEAYNSLIIPSGRSFTVKLSDGTEITLNAGSTLRYPVKFNDSIRSVEFSGEAYFRVKKSDKPFIVNINDVYVRVYGTEFNVNTQPKNIIETVLVNGRVGVGNKHMNNEMVITHNQLISYDLNENKSICTDVNTTDYISWKDDLFLYNDRSLTHILNDFNAWYGVEFMLEGDIDKSLTLRVSRTTSLEEMLSIIEIAADVKFIKQNKTGSSKKVCWYFCPERTFPNLPTNYCNSIPTFQPSYGTPTRGGLR